MPIPTIKEPDASPKWLLERCCFCRQQTNYWTNIKRRKPGTQVACCQECALIYYQKDVPTKVQWCEKEDQIKYERSNAYVKSQMQIDKKQKINNQLDELTNQLISLRNTIDNILKIRKGHGA